MSVTSACTSRPTHPQGSTVIASVVDTQDGITMDRLPPRPVDDPPTATTRPPPQAGPSASPIDQAPSDHETARIDFLAAQSVLEAARTAASRVLRTVINDFLR